MKAIILAAGRGTRLADVTGDMPKCLMRMGGNTLLERQIATLRACGVAATTVVAGYKAPEVASVCHPAAETIENSRFPETNSLYSLWLARHLLGDGFVVMNGDVLFHPQLLRDLLSSRFEDAILVAFRDHELEPYGEEEMKVEVRGGLVSGISKTMPPHLADGENVGIAKFGPSGARLLVEQLDAIVSEGSLRDWAPAAFERFARLRPLHVVGTRGYPWIEIDFPQDYVRAVNDVLRDIEEAARPSSTVPTVTMMPPVVSSDAGAEWRTQQGHV
jgi:choline kinase